MTIQELRKSIDDYVGNGGNPGLVVRVVGEAMEETADHIRTNWQDAKLAREWSRAAARVEGFGSKLAGWYTSLR
jgi:hypothetical protein